MCYCDNCLVRNPLPITECETPKTLEELQLEVLEEFGEVDYDTTRKCPGFKTSLVNYECGVDLDDDEDDELCESCQVNYIRQLDYEDDAVEEALQRQLDNEEYQLLRWEDSDGDDVEF